MHLREKSRSWADPSMARLPDGTVAAAPAIVSRATSIITTGNTQMAEGRISKLMTKGFGFIKREGGEKDLFFHSSAVKGVTFNEVHLGQKVSYTEGMGAKGPCAENVKLV